MVNKIGKVGQLYAAGKSGEQIALETGLTSQTVKTYRAIANREARHPPRQTPKWPRNLSFEAQKALAPLALARSMTIPELSVLIMEIIARDGLVGAILDDGDQN